MKIKFFVLASMLLALAACNAPQEKATEAPVQQPVQVSEAVDYQPIANPLKKSTSWWATSTRQPRHGQPFWTSQCQR